MMRGGATGAPNQAGAPDGPPRFLVEPEPFFEYSNSTGAVRQCRPANSQQVAVRWLQLAPASDPFDEQRALEVPKLMADINHKQQQHHHHHHQQQQQHDREEENRWPRYVRRDGSLVIAPFAAAHFKPDVHSAAYRCCLTNRLGSLCSRTVRSRAVLDTQLNLEVFDEFVLAGNLATFKCQIPSHLIAHLDFVAWLKDDKLIPDLLDEQRLARRLQRPELGAVKFVKLQDGHLLIRNVSKHDVGSYKCRVRNKLTNRLATSRIGGQLIVEDYTTSPGGTQSNNNNKLYQLKAMQTSEQQRVNVIFARENSAVMFCAKFQSFPAAKFTWFKVAALADSNNNKSNKPKERLSFELEPQMRQIDSCLLISSVQLRHSAEFICEAHNEPIHSTISYSIRLFVWPAQQQPAQAQVQFQLANHNKQQQPPARLLANGQVDQFVPLGAHIQLNCPLAEPGNQMQPRPDQIVWLKDGRLLASSSAVGGGEQDMADMVNANETGNKLSGPRNKLQLVQANVITVNEFDLTDRGMYQCQLAYSSMGAVKRQLERSIELLTGLNASKLVELFNQNSEVRSMLAQFEAHLELGHLQWGARSSHLHLTVALQRPQLAQKFPPAQSHPAGSSITLECSATGTPRPRIFWFLDEFLLINADDFQDDQQQQLEALDDEQLDQLAASNEHKQQQITFNGLNSLGSSLLSLSIARRRHNLNGLSIRDKRFNIVEVQQQQATLVLSRLNITRASLGETGHYKCLAINSLGQVSHSGRVAVVVVADGRPGNKGAIKLRKYQPSNVTLIAGQRAQLSCPLVGQPSERVDWFLSDKPLPAAGHQRQHPEPSKWGGGRQHLELVSVDPQLDAGLYSCRVRLNQTAGELEPGELAAKQQQEQAERAEDDTDDDDGQLVDENKLSLIQTNVKVAPQIDLQTLPELIQANEGQRTKLVCSIVQGDHPMDIKWLKRIHGHDHQRTKSVQLNEFSLDGFQLMQNVPDETTSTGASSELITLHNLEDSSLLTFRQISYVDSGDYICLAQNQFGLTSRRVRVVVNFAPIWSVEPSDRYEVQLGQRLQIDCLAHANPSPSIMWRKSSSRRKQSNPNELEDQSKRVSDNEVDEENTEDRDVADFVDLMQNYRQYSLANGSLIFEQVELGDSGLFACDASNGIGLGLTKVVRVHVQVPPYFKPTKATATTLLGQLDGLVELRCVVHGDQPMQINWRKQQREDDNHPAGENYGPEQLALLANQHHQQEGAGNKRRLELREHRLNYQSIESTVVVSNLTRSDSGQFVCSASNSFGTEEHKVTLVVQEPPEPPQLLRPIRTSARQATLTFRRPFQGQSTIRKYLIYFKQLDSASVELPATVSFNETSSAANDQAATTNWQQILVDAPSAADEEHSRTSGPDQQQVVSLNLCCLKPFTRYLARVRALNDIGQSELSRAVGLITDEETIGGPPLDVGVEPTGAHSLKVRWRAPAKQLHNGLIRGFYIGYRATTSASQHNSFVHQQVAEQQQQQQAALISSDQQYQYKNVQLDLNPTPSHRLASLQVIPNLDWSLVEAQQLLEAQLFAQQQQQHPLSSSNATGAFASPQQIYTSYLTNLKRKTAYSIIVQAYNKIGAGPRSDQIIVSTLDAAPPMSPSLRVHSVNYNSAQFSWSTKRFSLSSLSNNQQQNQRPPVDESDELLLIGVDQTDDSDDPQAYFTMNYKLEDKVQQQLASSSSLAQQQRPTAGSDWQQRKISRRQQQQVQPFVLTNLRCGSIYSAYMTATNSLGQSEPGETVTFNTLGAAPRAPPTSQHFLQVNSTFVVLHLNAWLNSGCLISSFLIKFRPATVAATPAASASASATSQLNNKWISLEHQVYPTIQTTTISGVAVFSTRPLGQHQSQQQATSEQMQQLNPIRDNESAHQREAAKRIAAVQPPPIHQQQNQQQQQQQQQNLNDFILRNLLPSTTYRLLVEANSESGSTQAEYEFETGNFTSTTMAINVNGPIAPPAIDNGDSQQQEQEGRRRQPTSVNSGDFDFSFSDGSGQRVSSFGNNPLYQSKYALGVWSLTIFFVVASILMATATIILGFKSLIRLKPLAGSREGLLGSLICCSARSSSRSSTSGNDDNSNSSSHSGAGGGRGGCGPASSCYQLPEHSVDGLYCSLPSSRHHQHHLMLTESPGNSGHRHAATISGALLHNSSSLSSNFNVANADELAPNELASQVFPRAQMVGSSSLSTIANNGARFGAYMYGGQAATMRPNLAGQLARRLANNEDEQQPHRQQLAGCHMRPLSHYAATLGRPQQQQQHSTFMQNSQPVKFNSPIYGRIQHQQQQVASPLAQPQLEYQLFPANQSSSGTGTTTSGYETSNCAQQQQTRDQVSGETSGLYLQNQANNNLVADIYQQQLNKQHQLNAINLNESVNLFDQTTQGQLYFAEQEQGNNANGDYGLIFNQQQQHQTFDAGQLESILKQQQP